MENVQNDAQASGAAIGVGRGFGFSALIAFSSRGGGLSGWLPLIKKKVYKCAKCGFILDRA